jgi:hypothetical protein
MVRKNHHQSRIQHPIQQPLRKRVAISYVFCIKNAKSPSRSANARACPALATRA